MLADLGTPASDMGLDMSEEDFWAVWLHSSSVHAWEMGNLDTPDFCARIAAELGLADETNVEQRLRSWRLNLYPGVDELVASIPESIPVALLSNTNEVHWSHVAAGHIFSRFQYLFLSYETGHYKPMSGAYEQVTAYFNCDPADVLFLDDSPRNIEAALDVGFDAHRVAGVEESRAVIRSELGLEK